MNYEEYPVGIIPDYPESCGVQEGHAPHSHHAGDDGARGSELLDQQARGDKEVEVKKSVGEQQGIDDAAKHSVIPVDLLMRRVEYVGDWVEALEGQEVLKRQLRNCDCASSLCEMEVV